MANTPNTDLVQLYADGDTNWAELQNYSSGAAPSLEGEAFLQGNNCISQQISANKTGAASGLDYSATSPAGFVGGSDVFFFWWLFLFPSALNDYNETVGQTAPSSNNSGTASGFFIGIGSSDTTHDWYAVGGSDYGRYPYGGWQNVAIDPTRSASWTDGPPTAGVYTNFGFLPNVVSAPSRGQSLVVDAIRWGRGQITYTGGAPAGTFDQIADTNDLVANRWGLFQRTSGGFLFKGLLELGLNISSLLFSDANKTINIDDTRQVYSDFNVIQVNNAASDITWDNITIQKLLNITSLGFDNSKGSLIINDNATFTASNCTFIDMNTFSLGGSNTTITGTVFRRTSTVTQNGSNLTDCTFEATTADVHLVADSPSIINNCLFIGDNTSHAIDLGTILTSTSINWNSSYDTSTYASVSQTQNATSTPGDSEVLLVNVAAGQTLTINVTGGTAPTYRNIGAGSVAIVASVTYSITNLIEKSEVRIVDADTNTILAGVESVEATPIDVDGVVVDADPNFAGRYRVRYTYNQTDAPINVRIVVMNLQYIHFSQSVVLGTTDGELLVSQIFDRNYVNEEPPAPASIGPLYSLTSPVYRWDVGYNSALSTTSLTVTWDDVVVFEESTFITFDQELVDRTEVIGNDGNTYTRGTIQSSTGTLDGNGDADASYEVTQIPA